MEAMEAAAKEAEVQDDAERRLPSPPSTPGSEASEETPMHAAWWAEERPDLLASATALASYHDTTRPMQLAWDGCCRGWEVFFDEADMGRWSL